MKSSNVVLIQFYIQSVSLVFLHGAALNICWNNVHSLHPAALPTSFDPHSELDDDPKESSATGSQSAGEASAQPFRKNRLQAPPSQRHTWPVPTRSPVEHFRVPRRLHVSISRIPEKCVSLGHLDSKKQ